MSTSHLAGNRNSTPDASACSLRPPTSRTMPGHSLHQSADIATFTSSQLRAYIRPASEVIGNQSRQNHLDDGLDTAAQQWIADIDQYEATLDEMAAATLDRDFKDELSAIEQWFRVLSEAERTAALYALLQQTTQVQIRFFIQVLQQMANSHPITGILSPANFGEKDPMSLKLSDAMHKLNVGDRNSFAGLGRPPPSPGNKRNSGLDLSTIYSMFPDAAAAIAKQKADFTERTGMEPTSNRNSTVERRSLVAPTISAPIEESCKENLPQVLGSPWGVRGDSQQPIARPKSSSSQQPMGQFAATPIPPGLRSPRRNLSTDGSVQNTTVSASTVDSTGMSLLSPYPSGNWASMVNTPAVASFNTPQTAAQQADMVANATAMKLAALSTVNNRIQLDDVRKYRRARSTDGQNGTGYSSVMTGQGAGIPPANIVMTNELGQFLTPQQAATLQVQQLATLQGHRSRPSSPSSLMVHGAAAMPAMTFASPQTNGFLSAYDGSNGLMNPQLAGLSLAQFGIGMGGGHDGYLSDHSGMERGRSPRGRRGSSRPPEDPTDARLLENIPDWLRSLRLHKYTDNLKDMSWKDLVELDDEGLVRKGVNALGARRKMLKVFEQIKEAQQDGKL